MTNNSTIASEVLAASLGGAISASILYPLEVLKTKMQAETSDKENHDDISSSDGNKKTMIQYARHLYDTHGPSVFLEGMEWSAVQSTVEKALYFFAYEALKSLYTSTTRTTSIPPIPNLTLGCIAEWAHLPITLPLDCWTTKIQTNTDRSKNAMVLLTSMLSEKGTRGMYKGIQAYVVLCFKPALQYTIFEQVKALMVKSRRHKHLHAAEAFLLGMVARVVATLFVFPYVRAKVVLQTQKESTTSEDGESATTNKKTSIPALLQDMYADGGIPLIYQGITPELTRGVLSSALMLMIKEKVAQLVQGMLRATEQQKRLGRR